MAFALRCPTCRKAFRWDATADWPDECQICGEPMAEDKSDTAIVLPAFLSSKTKLNDKFYREQERSSEARAEKAAEAAGVPVSEMADLKITNMRDNVKPGEISAMPVQNAVTQHMEAVNAKGGQFGFAGNNGLEFSAGINTGAVTVNGQTTQGVVPRAGANAIARVQRMNGAG